MADRATIDATLERYYEAWSTRDHELYRTVWAEDAAFADPPTDGEVPPTGFDQILAGMEEVWARAESIVYDRHRSWPGAAARGVPGLRPGRDGVRRPTRVDANGKLNFSALQFRFGRQ